MRVTEIQKQLKRTAFVSEKQDSTDSASLPVAQTTTRSQQPPDDEHLMLSGVEEVQATMNQLSLSSGRSLRLRTSSPMI